MRKSLKIKVGAVGATFALAGALAIVSSGTTGAYFSDTKDGGITGTVGAVHLSAPIVDFAWTNMMPGEPKSATVDFTNTGTGLQDFYIVFNNRPALHALNNLGSYGEVHVTGGKTGDIRALFDSINLQDGRHGTATETGADYNSCSSIFVDTGCWPLPTKLKIAGSVGVQMTGSVSFAFNYASKMGTGSTGGPAQFNPYPLTALTDANDPLDRLGPAKDGLPFQIVAVQVGQTP